MAIGKNVRWGILGTARIAEKVGAAITATKDAELTAVASRDLSKAKSWAAERNIPRTFGSYSDLLADPNIDAVYIPLPTSLHREWTIAAAKAGKHILCEKPLAMSAAEVREMIAVCRDCNVQLMDGTFWVHHPRAAMMKKYLDDGTLGELRKVTTAFTFCWPEPPLDNIRLQPDLGGGALGDLGWYCVRAALWAFGELPERVYANARYVNGVDYNMNAILWFSGDRVASFDCGFDTVIRQWLEVAGTKGSLVCDDFVLARSDEKARFWIHDDAGAGRQIDAPPCVQQQSMIANFQNLIRAGKHDSSWLAESLATMRVLDALAESARLQGIVEIGS